MENKIVVKMKFGSHLYHMNNEKSDTDYIGIVLPTAEQILLQTADFQISQSTGNNESKNSNEDIDEQYYSIQRFLRMASKGELHAIDMLHAGDDNIISSSPLWDFIVENREMFYTNSMKAYIGYVRKQTAKYGVKGSRLAVLKEALAAAYEWKDMYSTVDELLPYLPTGEFAEIITKFNDNCGTQTFYEICDRKFQNTMGIGYLIECLEKIYAGYGHRAELAKDNNGVDWKAASHALRCAYQAKYIYINGGFTYPLPERDFLMDVKSGNLDYLTEVQPVLEELVDEVMELADESGYPDEVDTEEVNKIILSVHAQVLTKWTDD